MKRKRAHYTRLEQIGEIKRKEVIDMFKDGRTMREISHILRLNELTVACIVDDAIINRILITDLTRYMPNPTFKPRDYSDADDYTKHYAGAELEDTRSADERARDERHPYRYRGIYGNPFKQ
jgi:hypothetical protein